MYKCKHFNIKELVPKHIHSARGEKAWTLLDDRALKTLDALRENLDIPLTVNDWSWGGNSQWSGLRTVKSPYYSPTSQHSFGRAFDVVSSQMEAEDMIQHVLDNPDLYPHVRGVETGVTWLHFDIGNRPGDGIYTFTA